MTNSSITARKFYLLQKCAAVPWRQRDGRSCLCPPQSAGGIGKALIDAALARTARLACRRQYVDTSGVLPSCFPRLQPIEELEHLGKMRVVIAYDLPHHSDQGTIKLP
ncbi:hypothetical protein [Bradyrhizobium liaoningense]|uniref:hypothetical protein n=1 Tax=Bradyrhizobium liaoningense TaxID=43992 RepID=UPI001BA6E283|nr:hypothetical protein [Bradyrhizobium liaoningense]MBR1170080.1 hypothetical protein [Bradyrhizobium liaoningense]